MNILVAIPEKHLSQVISVEAQKKLGKLADVFYFFAAADLEPGRFRFLLEKTKPEIVVSCWESPRITLDLYIENPQLKYLCFLGGSVRPYVDLAAIEAGLIVTNWAESTARSVAEACLTMMLALQRRIFDFQLEMHQRRGWDIKDPVEGLFYQRIGLFGFGAVARALLAFLRPFQCRVNAFDPHVPDTVFADHEVVRSSSLEMLFSDNRIISIHAADTPENFHSVDAGMLSLLEDGGKVINTARGNIVDTAALVNELAAGRLSAALDVYEQEPLPADSSLRGLENCLLIAHKGGPTPDRRTDMGDFGVENIRRYVHGEVLEGMIGPQRYSTIT